MAKSFFRQNNLQYEELNVATDEVAREEMVRRSGGFSVPVIDIDGQLMLGYNIEKLRNLLK